MNTKDNQIKFNKKNKNTNNRISKWPERALGKKKQTRKESKNIYKKISKISRLSKNIKKKFATHANGKIKMFL